MLFVSCTRSWAFTEASKPECLRVSRAVPNPWCGAQGGRAKVRSFSMASYSFLGFHRFWSSFIAAFCKGSVQVDVVVVVVVVAVVAVAVVVVVFIQS